MKRRKPPVSDRAFLKRVFSVYFAAHILVTASFLLPAGLDLARRGSEKVWNGTSETCITVEDLNKWRAELDEWLSYLYNNNGFRRFFEKSY